MDDAKGMVSAEARVKSLLSSVEREGMADLIAYMSGCGFFTAPCSGGHHLCCGGGLARHSLNVCDTALRLAVPLAPDLPKDSVIIVSLLHDLGKAGQFGKEYYTPNWVQDGKPTKKDPQQRYKLSEAKPYAVNRGLLHLDHCIRSAVVANEYIELTEEEQFAIIYHDGLYGVMKHELPGRETRLQTLVHYADFWVSHFMEGKVIQ